MGIADPCRCGDTRAWLLRPVRERNAVMAVETRGANKEFARFGWYEARLCAGCGHTRFWAREYDPGRAPVRIDPCRECGGTSGWTVSEAPDILYTHAAVPIRVKLAPTRFKPSLMFSHYGWRGTLESHVCSRCFATGWSCRADSVYPDDLGESAPAPAPCRRCNGPQTRSELHDHAFDDEGGGLERSIASKPGWLGYVSTRGRFQVDVCLRCFGVEWYGVRLDELREDPDMGITRLAPNPHGDGGPYR